METFLRFSIFIFIIIRMTIDAADQDRDRDEDDGDMEYMEYMDADPGKNVLGDNFTVSISIV